MIRPARARERLLLVTILSAYTVWATAYILRTSVMIDGIRHFVLFDDAMVSMRYARHLAEGHGLVWNIGEPPVEGFTNLAWTLYMAAFHLLPLGLHHLSAPIQITGLVMVIVTATLVWTYARSRLSLTATIAATVWTAFYLPLNTWALQGMEVGVLTLLEVAAILQLIAGVERQQFRAWPYVLFALAILVRMDAAVLAFTATLSITALDRRHRTRHLAWGLGVIAVAIGSLTLFRLWYFGEWLPNTYYLKMTGFPVIWRLTRGAAVFAEFVATANFLLFVAAALAVAVRPVAASILMAGQLAAASAYSVYVGGDAWEWWGGANRFLVPVMPLLFLMAATTLDYVLSGFKTVPSSVRTAAAAVVVGGLLVNLNLLSGWRSLAEWALLRPPLHTSELHDRIRAAKTLDAMLAPDARVAVIWAGALPYFLERPCIDLLGKADPVVARLVAPVPSGARRLIAFHPGHMKRDFVYSLDELQADVVVDVDDDPWARPHLQAQFVRTPIHGLPLSFRRGSPRIDWQQLAQATR